MLQSLSRTKSKHYFFCHLENGKCNFLRAKKILKESQSLWCVTMYGNIVSVYTLVRIPNGPYISVHSGICVPPLGIRVDLNEGCILGVFRYFPEFSEIFGFFLPKNWTRFFLFLVFFYQPCGATTVVVAFFFLRRQDVSMGPIPRSREPFVALTYFLDSAHNWCRPRIARVVSSRPS